MNEMETALKDMIIERYGSLKKFCDTVDMPWTTLDSILKRGVSNSNISNVLKITKELGISAEKLADGEIVESINLVSVPHPSITIAAHFDGNEFTEDELDDIRAYAEFVKNRRNRS